METTFNDIKKKVLAFINAYDYKTDVDTFVEENIIQLRILYKPDYFREGHEYYKKGICDIIILFADSSSVIVKQTLSGSWCFAYLDRPYNVAEEVWHLSDEQNEIIKSLLPALEAGFKYRNAYGNIYIIDKKKHS